MSGKSVVVWFRQDLRTADQPALAAAAETGLPVVPLYVLDDVTPGEWRPGGASRWWLHHSLAALAADLAALGTPLVLRRGASAELVARVAREVAADAVFCTGHVEPFWLAAERELEERLAEQGARLHRLPGTTLFAPGTVRAGDGGPLKVFTPFWKACLALPPPPRPVPAPRALSAPAEPPASDPLEAWALLPTRPDWAGGLRETWRPSEATARRRLAAFADGSLAGYRHDRDRPDLSKTSSLSPHLHWGEISVRQAWHCVAATAEARPQLGEDAHAWLRELGWREFAAHSLARAPHLPETPLQPRFADFPSREDPAALDAWRRGRTGYPIVDAGLRQLWSIGWMHNRVRMIAASFLIKHLLVPWQTGEAWYWDTLVDADLANNSAGWQWVAGCGIDAAPFFRIFNPILQGEKFDPDGAYVRRWVPELARVPSRWIHHPWEAPPLDLDGAGVRIGIDYPTSIVDHQTARKRALAAFEALGATSAA